MTSVHIRRVKFGHQHTWMEGRHCEDTGQRWLSKSQRERTGTESSPGLSERTNPNNTLVLNF